MLRQLFTTLISVQTTDTIVQQRGRSLITIALVLATTGLIGIPVSANAGNTVVGIVSFVFNCLSQGLVIVLARRGYVGAASAIGAGMLTAAILGIQIAVPQNMLIAVYFTLVIVVAGYTMASRSIVITSGVVLALLVWIGSNPAIQATNAASKTGALLIIGSAIISITLVSLLGATTNTNNVRALSAAQARAEQAMREVGETNRLLEQRVSERTASLSALLHERDEQAAQLREAITARQELDRALFETEIPVIPVRRDVLVVPLVGGLDSRRANRLVERVLREVEHSRARHVMLDVTGVPVIDTAVAGALIRTAQATGLLGTRTTLVGIRPEVAQTLVGLGVDFSQLRTFATLEDGLGSIDPIK
jgi:rsbT co-antagonist protein RsbR